MADNKTLAYTFSADGSVRGAVTGTLHKWKKGDAIEAPVGEFRAVPRDVVTAKPAEKTKK